jgi:magnesium chelatase subunit D
VGNWETREIREIRGIRETREIREIRETREIREIRETRETRETRRQFFPTPHSPLPTPLFFGFRYLWKVIEVRLKRRSQIMG